MVFPAPSSTVSLLSQLPLPIPAPVSQASSPFHLHPGLVLEGMPCLSSSATQPNLTRLCFVSWDLKFQRKKKKGGLVCPFAWLLDPDLQGWELSGERGRWESEGQPPSLVRVGLTGNLGGPEGRREGEARWPEGTAEKASQG